MSDRLKQVLDAIPFPITLVDVEGRVECVNEALERFAGCSLAHMVGQPGLELIESLSHRFADPERHLRLARDGFATAGREQEQRFALRDGGWARRWSLPVGDGTYAGRLVLLVDDTTRVAGEELASRLSSELVRAQEHERARLASELHDGPVQALAASLLRLDLLESGGGLDEDVAALVGALRGDLRTAYGEMRSLLFNLRPETLLRDGLSAALGQALELFREQTGIEATLEDELSAPEQDERALVAFRVLQEALMNVRKHADASHVRIALKGGEVLSIELEDDGRGFDTGVAPEETRFGHIGMTTMSERVGLAGGSFEIDSEPGKGTRIAFTLPPMPD